MDISRWHTELIDDQCHIHLRPRLLPGFPPPCQGRGRSSGCRRAPRYVLRAQRSLPLLLFLNADTEGKQAHPNRISVFRLYATTYPRSGWHSRGT